jgi:hypothetical protein
MADPDPIVFWTYSDDCAGVEGRRDNDEGGFWGVWYPLVIDGDVVGEVMVDYAYNFHGGWCFVLRPLGDHDLEVDTTNGKPDDERD